MRTLVAAYQMIMPGEWARSHRHTPNALRLILDAEPGTYTEVDGVKIAMEPGDVLLTPNWSSHGHGNDSRACAYWLDFLDVPLVQLLGADVLRADRGGRRAKRPTSVGADQGLAVRVPVERDAADGSDAAQPDPAGPFGTQVELGDPAHGHHRRCT